MGLKINRVAYLYELLFLVLKKVNLLTKTFEL